jgi:hypothetical protein
MTRMRWVGWVVAPGVVAASGLALFGAEQPKPAKPAEELTPVTWRRVGGAPLPPPTAATPAVVPASLERRAESLRPPVIVVELESPALVAAPVSHHWPVVLPKPPSGWHDPTHPVGPGQPPELPPPTVSVVRTGK